MSRKVSLFVPCFVDQLQPEVAVDTVKVLRRIGCEVDFPTDQTCCGQPAFNSGFWDEARPCAERFLRVFRNAETIVCPSGSCATMVRIFYPELLASGAMQDEAVVLGKRTVVVFEIFGKGVGVSDVGGGF